LSKAHNVHKLNHFERLAHLAKDQKSTKIKLHWNTCTPSSNCGKHNT